MTRSEERENVFRLLFLQMFYPKEETEEEVDLYFQFDELASRVSEVDQKTVTERFNQVMEKLPEIDALLDSVTTGWKVNRMAKVDLTILRLAAYELNYDPEIPDGVAINEAVELAKKFGGDQSYGFVNGVLSKIKAAKEQAGSVTAAAEPTAQTVAESTVTEPAEPADAAPAEDSQG